MNEKFKHKTWSLDIAEKIKALKMVGTTHELIAKILDMCEPTLYKFYRKELDHATQEANAKVCESLFKRATEKDCVTAQIFWLKTKARWKTADNISLLESNETLKEEIAMLRKKLEEENKKEY